MSVTFAWVLGYAKGTSASAFETFFREVEAGAAGRIPPDSAAVLANWYRDPSSLAAAAGRSDVHVEEAFNRAFDRPLEPFVHEALFHGAFAPWPASDDDMTLTTADRVPPLASLAVALGPAWVRRFPGRELQFFVPASRLATLAEPVGLLRAVGSTEREEMIARACSWLALHNFISFPDRAACDGREAAERLLEVLPAAVDHAIARDTCLFSACASFP